MAYTPKYKRVTKKMKLWLKTYAANACNVSQACLAAKISRATSYRWTAGCAEFKRLREEVEESMIDLAESKLMAMINKGDNLGALCFFLKCKGKSRGYVERTEQAHEGVLSLEIHRTILTPDDKPQNKVDKNSGGSDPNA